MDNIEASGSKLKDDMEASEPGNAERLRLRAKDHIHWVDTWGTWIVYRDGKWETDPHGVELQAYAKKVAKYLFALADGIHPGKEVMDKDPKDRSDAETAAHEKWTHHLSWANKSNTDTHFTRMVKLCRDLPGIRIHHSELDAHIFLLNVRNATIDFTSGVGIPRNHDPKDLLTKMALVTFDPEATCATWDRVLAEWQPSPDVQAFLARIAGSGLIGQALQYLFVNVGGGRNGKGTFYKHIIAILGEYAGTAPSDMLIEKKNAVHGEEMARLRGCRFLLSPETSAGDRLDETMVKNLTGGDWLHARHNYGKPFDFLPSHTAFLHTNNEPNIKGTDAAIWNRVIKIPWLVYIPEDERDPDLDDKLRLEYSGILNWLIHGAQGYLDYGLMKPPAIRLATEAYRADQDHIERFLKDCHGDMVTKANELGPVDYIPAQILRKRYEQWCEDEEGIRPWSAMAVGKELLHKGWVQVKPYANGKQIRAWSLMASCLKRSDQGTNTPQDDKTPKSYTSFVRKEFDVEKSTEVSRNGASESSHVLLDDWQPSEEQLHEAHLQWLRDHGYQLPPTEKEIQDYMAWEEGPPEPTEEELKVFWHMKEPT